MHVRVDVPHLIVEAAASTKNQPVNSIYDKVFACVLSVYSRSTCGLFETQNNKSVERAIKGLVDFFSPSQPWDLTSIHFWCTLKVAQAARVVSLIFFFCTVDPYRLSERTVSNPPPPNHDPFLPSSLGIPSWIFSETPSSTPQQHNWSVQSEFSHH